MRYSVVTYVGLALSFLASFIAAEEAVDRVVGPGGGQTPEEVRAWRLYGTYTRSKSIQRKAEANLEQWKAIIDAAKSGTNIDQINPEDAAIVTKLLRLIRDEGEQCLKVESIWNKEYSGYYGGLRERLDKTYSLTLTDPQRPGEPVSLTIDQMEYRLRAFPFGKRDKKKVTEPDEKAPLTVPPEPATAGETLVAKAPTSPPPVPAETLPPTPTVAEREPQPAAEVVKAPAVSTPSAVPAISVADVVPPLPVPVPIPVIVPVKVEKPAPPPVAKPAPTVKPAAQAIPAAVETKPATAGTVVSTPPTADEIRAWKQMSQQERFNALRSNNMSAWKVFRQETQEALNP